ncbi:hypothetical protein NM688_g2425 [Phlebia brevispora]|uniref:Uncharacterized protein n=1 Tax=Phlebia brevispora TaxID=194682 RepID=A0ACC1T8X1_9APHY|nr:hypothetical protein NM688_g2425 [Phlebia brevispora]
MKITASVVGLCVAFAASAGVAFAAPQFESGSDQCYQPYELCLGLGIEPLPCCDGSFCFPLFGFGLCIGEGLTSTSSTVTSTTVSASSTSSSSTGSGDGLPSITGPTLSVPSSSIPTPSAPSITSSRPDTTSSRSRTSSREPFPTVSCPGPLDCDNTGTNA